MFDNLSEKLQGIISTTRGKELTQDNMQEALREIRRALLEADVNLRVVKSFISSIKDKAEGEKVLEGVNPSEQLIKIVHDELVEVYSMRMYLGGPSIGNTYEKLYRYELKLPYESWMSAGVDDQYGMRARSYDIGYALTCYLNVTNMIIEVGDIHE